MSRRPLRQSVENAPKGAFFICGFPKAVNKFLHSSVVACSVCICSVFRDPVWLGARHDSEFCVLRSGDFDVNVFAQHIGRGFNLVKF